MQKTDLKQETEQLAACDSQGRRLSYPVLRNHSVPESVLLLGAIAFIENHDHQILVSRRANQKSQGGKWECPGGMVRFRESCFVAIQRELKEELGISVAPSNCEWLGNVFRSHQKIAVFHIRMDMDTAELILQNEEVTEARWLALEDFEAWMMAGKFADFSVWVPPLIQEILKG